MKVLLVVAALFAMLLQVYSQHAGPAIGKCLADNKATMDDLKTFADSGVATDGLKCAMKCILLERGAMTEDGKFHPEGFRKPIGQSDEVKECMTIEKGSGDLCDLAYRQNVCMREKSAYFSKMGSKH